MNKLFSIVERFNTSILSTKELFRFVDFKGLFCTEKLVLNTGLKTSDIQIQIRLRFGMANPINDFKTKKTPKIF